MTRSASRLHRLGAVVAGALCAGFLFPVAAHAGKPCKNCADTTAPTVSISAPSSGTSVAGAVAVKGASSDNAAVASVAVQVDGGAWQAVTGTTSWAWTWSSTAAVNGTHTLTARATDTSGNTRTVADTVTVANPVPDTTPPSAAIASPAPGATVSGTITVSGSSADNKSVASVAVAVDGGAWQAATGTTSWTWPWSTTAVADGTHTLTARATDTSGNSTTTSESVTVSNVVVNPPPPPPPPPADPPATQGTWVSPEGLTISVDSAGAWTIAQIYAMVKANALDLDKVGPTLSINVQDQYGNQTQTSATYYRGQYTSVSSTMWLLGSANSNFALTPDAVLAHEYGHAWSNYWYYTAHQANWSAYLNARWTTADGSQTLATDPRAQTTYSWTTPEIVADDYRLLFGAPAAISERPGHLNSQIADPRSVPGLAAFLLDVWRAS